MELKSDLEQWRDGCVAFDNKDFDTALRTFMRIGDNARMHFNIGLIFIILQDHRRSLAAFKKALEMDPFFAVACFQRGVSHFSLGDVARAYEDFDLAHKKLRGNTIINYHQLGLSFRLYECEVLFNRGICQLYLGRIDAGLTDLYYAQKNKVSNEHDIIDDAVKERGRNFSVYSIPQGVLFRPSETKMERMRKYQEFHGDTMYYEEEPRRQNSVLLPPSAPWMQQEDTKAGAFLTVPQPTRYHPVLDRAPSPEEPDPFMRDWPGHPPSNPYPTDDMRQPSPMGGGDDHLMQSNYVPTQIIDERWRRPTTTTTTTTTRGALNDERNVHAAETVVRPTSEEKWKFVDGRTNWENSASYFDNENGKEADYTGTLETMSYFGDSLDDELDKVYASLNQYLSTNSKPAVEVRSPPPPPPTTSPDAKMKIKLHYHDTRILLVPSSITLSELLTRVKAKFNASETLRLQYKDEEGVLVLVIDQNDLNMARQLSLARGSTTAQRHPALEKLELWCVSSS